MTKSDWQTSGMGALLCGAILVAGAVLVYFTERAYLKPGDSIQILALIILAAVTLWYAISTHRINKSANEQAIAIREQAETSRRALQVALDAEKNAVLPVVTLTTGGSSSGSLVTEVNANGSNIGSGPAMNLRIWLESSSGDPAVTHKSSTKPYNVLGVGESRTLRWRHTSEDKPLPSFEMGFYVVAEYSDIFGRRFGSRIFSSREDTDHEFTFFAITK